MVCNHRENNMSLALLKAGLTQIEIDTSIKVLSSLSLSKQPQNQSTIEQTDGGENEFTSLKELELAIKTINTYQPQIEKNKNTLSNEVGLQKLYQILQLLPRNVYFSMRRMNNFFMEGKTKFPSLLAALSEHVDISKPKQILKKIKMMKLSPRRFPLLFFPKPKLALMMIKKHADDDVLACPIPNYSAPNLSAMMIPSMVQIQDQEEHPMYCKLKQLTRNSFYAIRPNNQPNILNALQNLNGPSIQSHYTFNQKQILIFLDLARMTPRLFPLLFIHPKKYKGSFWILIKSDINVKVIGNPKSQLEEKIKVTAQNDEEVTQIMNEVAASIYNEIIINLDKDLLFLINPQGFDMKQLKNATNMENDISKDAKMVQSLFHACKEKKPSLKRYQFQIFKQQYKKKPKLFPKFQRVSWVNSDKKYHAFRVHSNSNCDIES